MYTNDTMTLGFYGHHDYERNYANNTYFTLKCHVIEINGTKYLFDKIVEYNQTAEIIWEKDTMDFVNISQWCPFSDMESGIADLTHSNSVFYDEDDDSIYLNMRNTNTFYKLDHKTGDIIWALGEYGDFAMYDLHGKKKNILFYHGHALEKVSNDTFIYFDNDLHNQTDATNFHSRIMEIRINVEKMMANITWEWIAPTEYYSGWWGDADKLPNKNRLGVFGTHSHPSTDLGARIVEVTEEGNITWDLSFAPDGLATFGAYRVERIRFAPFVSEPRIQNLSETERVVEWDIWYNFRSKTEFEGSYEIIIDNEIIKEEKINFPKYWKSLTVNCVLKDLSVGEHTVRIVVMDEAGHLSNETEFEDSMDTITFSVLVSKGLVIGLSVGGSFILIATLILIWFKIIKKKRMIKK
ncbi:MAG: aryl-sulfate sulfotransferase [Candidatus Heimdallarchaeaceae archaeon]